MAVLIGITLNACDSSEEVKNTDAEDQTVGGVAEEIGQKSARYLF